MIIKSLQNLWDGVLAATDHDLDQLVSPTQLTAWINEDVREFWGLVAPICRDEFTTLSGTLTVAGGASTINLDATVPDFLALRGVDKDLGGGRWWPLKPWRFAGRGEIVMLSYRQTQRTIRLEPALEAPGSYRIWYIPEPAEFLVGTPSATLDFPYGGDKYVIQGVAARVRARHDESPKPQLEAQAAALEQARLWLALGSQQGEPEGIVDVTGEYT